MKMRTAETTSPSLGVQTADQSCELNVYQVKTNLQKVFPSDIKRTIFFEIGKSHLKCV